MVSALGYFTILPSLGFLSVKVWVGECLLDPGERLGRVLPRPPLRLGELVHGVGAVPLVARDQLLVDAGLRAGLVAVVVLVALREKSSILRHLQTL